MRKYLQTSFWTLTGIKKLIDLGDQAYAEWIVYDSNLPKYHVNLYSEHRSDIMIHRSINKKENTIEGIIKSINARFETKLSLINKPLILLTKKEELIELDLGPLPEHWIKNII